MSWCLLLHNRKCFGHLALLKLTSSVWSFSYSGCLDWATWACTNTVPWSFYVLLCCSLRSRCPFRECWCSQFATFFACQGCPHRFAKALFWRDCRLQGCWCEQAKTVCRNRSWSLRPRICLQGQSPSPRCRLFLIISKINVPAPFIAGSDALPWYCLSDFSPKAVWGRCP